MHRMTVLAIIRRSNFTTSLSQKLSSPFLNMLPHTLGQYFLEDWLKNFASYVMLFRVMKLDRISSTQSHDISSPPHVTLNPQLSLTLVQ